MTTTVKRRCVYGTLTEQGSIGTFAPCQRPATHTVRDLNKPFFVEPICEECAAAAVAQNPKLLTEPF